MQRKKGFTLVELLAVIVILSIILVIAVPNVLRIIEQARIDSYEKQKEFISDAARKYVAQNRNGVTFDAVNRAEVTLAALQSNGLLPNPLKDSRGNTFDSNKTIVVISELNGQYTYQVSVESDLYDSTKGVNIPQLAPGMTPIKWNGSNLEETTADDPNWYSYDTTNKNWANARTVDGSMWVWIPAYAYQIATNYHTSAAGTINIKFLKGLTKTASDGSVVDVIPTYGGSNNQTNFIEHPAFRFGSNRVAGIWVAKFEATAAEGVANGYTADGSCPIVGDNVVKTIKVIPNAMSWRCNSIFTAYTASRNMETNSIYGWGTSGNDIDTHLMKNSEWGAVAYLSRSSYGQTTEIWINPANDYTTGCAGDSVSSASTTGCLRAYNNTPNGVKASTTGNIYGIYDMSGGAYERTMSNYNNKGASSGWSDAQVTALETKYIDRYYTDPSNMLNGVGYDYDTNIYGDAMYETSIGAARYNGTSWVGSTAASWNTDLSYTPFTSVPWFGRGGYCSNTHSAGAFAFGSTVGGADSYGGFRPVVVIGAGL